MLEKEEKNPIFKSDLADFEKKNQNFLFQVELRHSVKAYVHYSASAKKEK